jgi:hypothetical protein
VLPSIEAQIVVYWFMMLKVTNLIKIR